MYFSSLTFPKRWTQQCCLIGIGSNSKFSTVCCRITPFHLFNKITLLEMLSQMADSHLTLHLFCCPSKLISQPPVTQTPKYLAPVGLDPQHFHVRIDLGHILAPFIAQIDQMCPKSGLLVVHDQND